MPNPRARNLASQLDRNLLILAVLSIVFLGALAIAPAKGWLSDWRITQSRYNGRAAAAGMPEIPIRIQQIWRPEIALTDRCTSCHVGMGNAKPLPGGEALFGEHPPVHHDVAQMGCTICHRGQGRATTAAGAHGFVRHWEDPLLPLSLTEASCGGCHGPAVSLPPRDAAERGAYLFELHGCSACHTRDGSSGSVGPDLGGIALKGYTRDWQRQHLRAPTATVAGSRMMSFGHLSEHDVDDLITYLETLIGAPKLMRGKELAARLGCRGCHKIDGVGGDHGPALADAAKKTVADYDFTNVKGEHTVWNWHRQHLQDPQKVSPGSKMPPVRLAPDDLDALLTYVLSQRDPGVPMEQLPRRTLAVRIAARRDFPRDGANLFGMFCAGCHRPGESRALEMLSATVPNAVGADLLATASDEFLRNTIIHGRPGRDMPAWGPAGGGLDEAELDALVEWLTSHRPQRVSFEEVEEVLSRPAGVDLDQGMRLFRGNCAGCHGLDGEGTLVAPSLTNGEFWFVSSEHFLYETITSGRRDNGMPAHPHWDAESLAALIAWLRSHEPPPKDQAKMLADIRRILAVPELDNYRAGGSIAYGKTLFDGLCVGCHGPGGRGAVGPGIGTQAFMEHTPDSVIAGSIVLGRGGRAMRSFSAQGIAKLSGREIGDIITYLRSAAAEPSDTPRGPRVQGSVDHGAGLFKQHCKSCHGPDGQGQTAPALNNAAFLETATDGFLQATIARGRSGTAMRGWLSGGNSIAELAPQDINDIVAYIRTWNGTRR